MNKSELERKTGIVVLNNPTYFDKEDTTKVNVSLPCGHNKLASVKSLVKKVPKCLECCPKKKPADNTHTIDVLKTELEASDEDFLFEFLMKLIDDAPVKSAKIFCTLKRELEVKKELENA